MHKNHRPAYFFTFAALLVLLSLSAGATYFHTGRWAAPISLGIGVTKMTLIATFFMHLREAVPLVRALAFAGIFWLILLMTFLLSDYLTRRDVIPSSEQISQFRRSYNVEMLEYHSAADTDSNFSRTHQT